MGVSYLLHIACLSKIHGNEERLLAYAITVIKESIADHMYRMAIITMMCPDPTVKKDRCVKMAIIHDMAEALVGDITPLDKVPKGLCLLPFLSFSFNHSLILSHNLP